MRRILTGSALAALLVVGLAGPAAAVPGNGTGQSTFPLLCEGRLLTLTIGGGNWSAAYVHETGGRFVLRATHVLVTDIETGDVVFEEHDVKNSARKGPLTECTDVYEVDGVRVVFVAEGTLR
jgi:hypothetical protein